MDIFTRAEWGARPPKSTPTYVSPSKRLYFVLHHSGGPVTQTVRAIQDWCMDGRGFNDIDYNFLVRGDSGEIYEGRGWNIQGAHTVGYNVSGVGVCVIGIDQMSDEAKRSVRWLYDQYNTRCDRILTPKGHRDLDPPRDCPGDHNEAWLRAGLPLPIVKGWDEMATKTEIKDALRELLAEDITPYVGNPGARIRAAGWGDLTRDAKIDYLLELIMAKPGESIIGRLNEIEAKLDALAERVFPQPV